ncbi:MULTISPECIES: GtrA family protein [Burkholderia]|uniref:GtrA family protein n=1 Tax=Burkholderia TaxID=32008 RepID=UPI0009E7AEE2|nr:MULTISPECIES: GtrA family protein [Burkholderia]
MRRVDCAVTQERAPTGLADCRPFVAERRSDGRKTDVRRARMTHRHTLRFVTYLGVGVSGTAAQYVILWTLVSTAIAAPVFASAAGAVVGTLLNYVLNYHITFKRSRPHDQAVPRFFSVAFAGIVINVMAMFALICLHVPFMPAQVVATGCVLGATYLANSAWSFKR